MQILLALNFVKMTHFGKNIKKIRAIKNLSQAAFADIFGITRASVGAYEEGRAEAKIDTIIEIANYFSISLNQLLTKEITVNELYNFNPIKQLEKIQKIPQTSKSEARNLIPLIYNKFAYDYCVNYKNRAYIESLPTIQFFEGDNTNFRAFEHSGIEMQIGESGLCHGDWIYCKLTEIQHVANNTICAVIKKSDIMVRRVSIENDNLLLVADNKQYKSISLAFSDVIEIWEAVGVYSIMPLKINTYENRLSNLEEKVETWLKNAKT